jgi:hypothetical protein
MTDEEKVNRAKNAQRILDDPLFKDAVRAVRDRCIEDFKATKAGDVEGLRVARLTFETAELFVNVLAGHMRDGQIAQIKLDAAKQSRAKRPLQKA